MTNVQSPNGVHHLAISTSNIKAQIEYFTDVLGCELVALYWMHGVPNTFHGFLKLNDASYVAFVQSPAVAEIERALRRELAAAAFLLVERELELFGRQQILLN